MRELLRSTVPGDESTEPVPYKRFTDEERELKDKAEELTLIVRAGERAQKELSKLRGRCKHLVFYDIEGFPYDVRVCGICGEHYGLI